LFEAFAHVRHMPPLALQMLDTGEQAGRTGDSLRRAGDYLHEQAMHTLRIIARVIEGVVIVIIGLLLFGPLLLAGL